MSRRSLLSPGLIAGLLILSLELQIIIPSVVGFQHVNCRWPATNSSGVAYYDGASPAIIGPQVRLAAEAWNAVPALMYLKEVSDLSAANINVTSFNDPDSNVAGGTLQAQCSTGQFVGKASVLLNNAFLQDKPLDLRTEVAAHELGHALGLYESGILESLMWYSADNYRTYRIFVPVVDDIRGMAALYGWADDTYFESAQVLGSASASGTDPPIILQVSSPGPGSHAQVYRNTVLPESRIAIVMAYVRASTLYRFHVGWEMDRGPTNVLGRYATIELDIDGIKFVNTFVGSPYVVTFADTKPLVVNPMYFLELVVEQIGGDVNRVKATAYAFLGDLQTANGGELFKGSFDSSDIVRCCVDTWLHSWTDAKFLDAAVWTDSSSDPTPYYRLDHFWNFQGAALKPAPPPEGVYGDGGGGLGCPTGLRCVM